MRGISNLSRVGTGPPVADLPSFTIHQGGGTTQWEPIASGLLTLFASSTLLLFLPDALELSDGFQVLRAASRALGLNERWQIEAAAPDAKDFYFDGVVQQILIAAPTCAPPRRSRGPTLVSSMKFRPMRRVATDHWNGSPGGAPHK
jgi:hypothetical protein